MRAWDTHGVARGPQKHGLRPQALRRATRDTDGQTKLGAERVVILKSFRKGRMVLSISPGLVREQPKPCRRPGGGRGRPGHWSPGAGRARGWAQEPTRHLHVPPARPSAARRARVLCVHYMHRYGRVPHNHVSANGGWRTRRVPRDCRGAETFPKPSEVAARGAMAQGGTRVCGDAGLNEPRHRQPPKGSARTATGRPGPWVTGLVCALAVARRCASRGRPCR